MVLEEDVEDGLRLVGVGYEHLHKERSTSATGQCAAETLQTAEHVRPRPLLPGAPAAVQIAHSGVCFGRPYFYN